MNYFKIKSKKNKFDLIKYYLHFTLTTKYLFKNNNFLYTFPLQSASIYNTKV